MKTIPIALAANLAGGAPTPAFALKVTRTDDEVFGFTSSGRTVTIGGVEYDGSQGLDISSIVTSAGLAVDNLELTTLDDGTLFSRAEVLAGVWQNAAFEIFQYNWASPTDGINPLLAGTIGQVKLLQGAISCELRCLKQYLQQSVGSVGSKTCRANFCDFPRQAGNALCGLTAATWTDAYTVGTVTSRREFTITGGTPPADDWYANGVLTVIDGDNAGRHGTVKAYTQSSGVVELHLALPHDLAPGDAVELLAGCYGRLEEDCRDRYDNVINHQGEPHLPGVDRLTQTPEPSA